MPAYRGFGKIKMAPYDAAIPFYSRAFVDIGNNSAFALTATEQSEDLPDYRDASGGIDASYRRVESAGGSIDARHVNGETLAMATWGVATDIVSAAITGESHVLHVGKFVPSEHIIDLTVPVVVKAGSTTLNTADYVASAGGVTFAAVLQTADVDDGDAITLEYTSADEVNVEALINTAPNVSILFEGINAVDGKSLIVPIWKAKLGVAQNIALIGTEFATLGLTYTIEKDETVPGVGTSKFYKIQQGA